jgi:hypothetical protein
MWADLQVLHLGAYDTILGYDWLSKHSPMVCDWANYFVEFQEKDKSIKLQSIQPAPLQPQEVTADSFGKWYKGNDTWALAVIHQLDSVPQSTSPEIGALLQKYAGVFAKPTSLPPARVYDHTIPLLPNTTTVNSRCQLSSLQILTTPQI